MPWTRNSHRRRNTHTPVVTSKATGGGGTKVSAVYCTPAYTHVNASILSLQYPNHTCARGNDLTEDFPCRQFRHTGIDNIHIVSALHQHRRNVPNAQQRNLSVTVILSLLSCSFMTISFPWKSEHVLSLPNNWFFS